MMLSAFKARPIYEVKQRDKSKIESLLAYGDRLLVGLNSGSLRIYRVNDSEITSEDDVSTGVDRHEAQPDKQAKGRAVELLDEKEKFSRRPVQQLAMIKEANLLISLSDTYVSFHDLQTFELSEKLEKTKGAKLFAATSNIVKDEETDIPALWSRLAVAVKRKVLVWSWQDGELTGAATESTLIAPVKTLAWATGTKLVLGMDPGYFVLDIESQAVTDINKPGVAGEVEGQEGSRFGAVNSSGMSYMGMSSWIPDPLVTKLSEDELLLAKDVNTLFIDTDGKALERRQIPWPVPPAAIGYSYPYMLSLKEPSKGALEIRNPKTTSLLQTIPLPNATILHVPQPTISLAHAGKGFLVASDRCIWRMGALDYESQIHELVSKTRYNEALSLLDMLEDTLLKDKNGRIREVKILTAEALFDERKYRASLELFIEASAPPEHVIALYPDVISGGHRNKTDGSENKLEGRDLMIAVNELCSFLVGTRTALRNYIDYDGALKQALPTKNSSDYVKVTSLFDHFLVSTSQQEDINWQKELFDVAVLVDTTLFRAYMLVKPQFAGSLFRLDNFCDAKVVEDKLYESHRYLDLIDFLHGKKNHHEALKLLEKFGKGDAKGEISETLRGPQRTVAYLQQLPFELIDLILQYARWPIKTDPAVGMQIFLADTENAETLPRNRVVDFLEGLDSSLALRYLEHIIIELNDQTPGFHDQLVNHYVKGLMKLDGDKSEAQLEQQAHLKKSLEDFVIASQQYNRGKLLRDLPQDAPVFYLTRAITYSKQSQHKKALEIYVFQLKDYEKAEEYCNQTHVSSIGTSLAPKDPDDPSESQSIYTILLALYLTPPSPHSANLDAALNLLSNHGARLPALSTLSVLPTNLPIKDLASYFAGRMRAANSLAREKAIVAALSGVDNSVWEGALLVGNEKSGMPGGRNRRVVIGEDRMCSVCHKRFGRTAVRVWPDGEVVHYGCVDRKRQHAPQRSGGAAVGRIGL